MSAHTYAYELIGLFRGIIALIDATDFRDQSEELLSARDLADLGITIVFSKLQDEKEAALKSAPEAAAS